MPWPAQIPELAILIRPFSSAECIFTIFAIRLTRELKFPEKNVTRELLGY